MRLLGHHGLRIGLDYNIDVSALFKFEFLSLVVLQGVLNANFLVKVIGTFNNNLGFLGLLRM